MSSSSALDHLSPAPGADEATPVVGDRWVTLRPGRDREAGRDDHGKPSAAGSSVDGLLARRGERASRRTKASSAEAIQRTLRWGEPWHLGSASYWVHRCRETVVPGYSHALGSTLVEEVAACILGGYGVPSEVGMAAFKRLRDEGRLRPGAEPTGEELERLLATPLQIGERSIRYRFAAQRGHRLAAAIAGLNGSAPHPTRPREMRSWLLDLPGIGPKTASWIVRNYLGSDDVAIVDVHLLRAGVIAGVFDPSWTPARDYFKLEEMFLAWARLGRVSAASLDALIWSDMARWGRAAPANLGAPTDRWSWYAS